MRTRGQERAREKAKSQEPRAGSLFLFLFPLHLHTTAPGFSHGVYEGVPGDGVAARVGGTETYKRGSCQGQGHG